MRAKNDPTTAHRVVLLPQTQLNLFCFPSQLYVFNVFIEQSEMLFVPQHSSQLSRSGTARLVFCLCDVQIKITPEYRPIESYAKHL